MATLSDLNALNPRTSKLVRRRWDLHVHHVADLAGLDRKAVIDWERGRREGDAEFRAKVWTVMRRMVLEYALETALLVGGDDPRLAGLRASGDKPKRDTAHRFAPRARVVLT